MSPDESVQESLHLSPLATLGPGRIPKVCFQSTDAADFFFFFQFLDTSKAYLIRASAYTTHDLKCLCPAFFQGYLLILLTSISISLP